VAASLLSSWRRQTEDSLRHARDELEVKVGERTAELKNANETLLKQIAEQRRTEESLEITRTELARVVRITTIGELTASIAHEVNQPLAAVVSNADACVAWLSHQNPNLREARAAAERTVHGATRASEVIAQIRSLINKTTPERKRVHINEIIEDTVALVNLQGMRNNVSVAIELTPDLPVVFGDRIQLQQVVLNLMMNGIEAMTAVTDRPRRLLIRSQMQDAGQVHVSVQDSGIGVSAEVMALLFEPFFTTRSKGIGMGLPISRSIIEAHGGRLWAESTVSQGSIFQFMLPSADGPVA
jgi:C4-dicarboxylate-specific signal transduction histidine kinase